MAKDIFLNDYNWGGSWKIDGQVITISTVGAKGGANAGQVQEETDLICNSCQISYARPVNKIIPLNSTKQFIVAGRGAGSCTLGMIVAPSKALATFMKKFADPCEIPTNEILIKGTGGYCDANGKNQGNQLTFRCRYCLLQSVNTSVQAGDVAIISAGTTLIIGQLDLE